MNAARCETALVALLRITGVLLLTALVAAVMPFAWMQQVHRSLGMGELPERPVVEYLARSLSALYAWHGALPSFVSRDLRHYLPLAKFLPVLAIGFGAGMLVLDIAAKMPPVWTACEGPFILILCGAMLWLAYRQSQA